MTGRLIRRLARLVPAPLALGLLLGCGAVDRSATAPTGQAPSVAGPSEPTATPTAVDLKAAALAKAAAAGETPTEAGVSELAREPDHASFLWESTKGHLCLAQTGLSGGFDARQCGDPATAKPEGDAAVAPVFGPGMAPKGWMFAFLTEHADRVASVRFRGEEVTWKFVRTLSPALTGRDLYYVQLPDAPKGDLDVTLHVGGQEKKERLHFT
ncbi:hypothetical protein K7B10_24240 [Streptomyces flavotricini]|uniref:Lipoprotein n=1 Tax=Streptomyces flavotricini TaxID=66888 RepID=A0ABS8EC66_9ACTN|nr:hypothetical protein [Streptomyces flavotricini]MCC0097829.1 hypothetical protein [Streptomyces flavotricini]